MKRFFFISLLICLSNSIYAQDSNVWEGEYRFQKKVEIELVNYLDKSLRVDSLLNFYLIIYKTEKEYTIFIDRIPYEDELSSIRKVIMSSNRFFYYKEKRIPIINEFDFYFGSHGVDIKGRIRRVNLVGELYYIEFNGEGKILKKGY